MNGLTVRVTPYQLPADGKAVIPALVALLDGTQHSIQGMLYSLTHPLLIAALERAHARGVIVSLILDRSQSVNEPEAKDLPALLAAVPGIRIGTASTGEIIHTKCAILDGRTVVTGSANWTTRGIEEQNDLLVIRSNTLAATYAASFAALAAWIDQHPQKPG